MSIRIVEALKRGASTLKREAIEARRDLRLQKMHLGSRLGFADTQKLPSVLNTLLASHADRQARQDEEAQIIQQLENSGILTEKAAKQVNKLDKIKAHQWAANITPAMVDEFDALAGTSLAGAGLFGSEIDSHLSSLTRGIVAGTEWTAHTMFHSEGLGRRYGTALFWGTVTSVGIFYAIGGAYSTFGLSLFASSAVSALAIKYHDRLPAGDKFTSLLRFTARQIAPFVFGAAGIYIISLLAQSNMEIEGVGRSVDMPGVVGSLGLCVHLVNNYVKKNLAEMEKAYSGMVNPGTKSHLRWLVASESYAIPSELGYMAILGALVITASYFIIGNTMAFSGLALVPMAIPVLGIALTAGMRGSETISTGIFNLINKQLPNEVKAHSLHTNLKIYLPLYGLGIGLGAAALVTAVTASALPFIAFGTLYGSLLTMVISQGHGVFFSTNTNFGQLEMQKASPRDPIGRREILQLVGDKIVLMINPHTGVHENSWGFTNTKLLLRKPFVVFAYLFDLVIHLMGFGNLRRPAITRRLISEARNVLDNLDDPARFESFVDWIMAHYREITNYHGAYFGDSQFEANEFNNLTADALAALLHPDELGVAVAPGDTALVVLNRLLLVPDLPARLAERFPGVTPNPEACLTLQETSSLRALLLGLDRSQWQKPERGQLQASNREIIEAYITACPQRREKCGRGGAAGFALGVLPNYRQVMEQKAFLDWVEGEHMPGIHQRILHEITEDIPPGARYLQLAANMEAAADYLDHDLQRSLRKADWGLIEQHELGLSDRANAAVWRALQSANIIAELGDGTAQIEMEAFNFRRRDQFHLPPGLRRYEDQVFNALHHRIRQRAWYEMYPDGANKFSRELDETIRAAVSQDYLMRAQEMRKVAETLREDASRGYISEADIEKRWAWEAGCYDPDITRAVHKVRKLRRGDDRIVRKGENVSEDMLDRGLTLYHSWENEPEMPVLPTTTTIAGTWTMVLNPRFRYYGKPGTLKGSKYICIHRKHVLTSSQTRLEERLSESPHFFAADNEPDAADGFLRGTDPLPPLHINGRDVVVDEYYFPDTSQAGITQLSNPRIKKLILREGGKEVDATETAQLPAGVGIATIHPLPSPVLEPAVFSVPLWDYKTMMDKNDTNIDTYLILPSAIIRDQQNKYLVVMYREKLHPWFDRKIKFKDPFPKLTYDDSDGIRVIPASVELVYTDPDTGHKRVAPVLSHWEFLHAGKNDAITGKTPEESATSREHLDRARLTFDDKGKLNGCTLLYSGAGEEVVLPESDWPRMWESLGMENDPRLKRREPIEVEVNPFVKKPRRPGDKAYYAIPYIKDGKRFWGFVRCPDGKWPMLFNKGQQQQSVTMINGAKV